jgi:hypothetical protein
LCGCIAAIAALSDTFAEGLAGASCIALQPTDGR